MAPAKLGLDCQLDQVGSGTVTGIDPTRTQFFLPDTRAKKTCPDLL